VVSDPPPEWPEHEAAHTLEQVREAFAGRVTAFGENWWQGIHLDRVTEPPGGRVLADITFELAGDQSRTPIRERAAAIHAVREGLIVRARHYMDPNRARESAKE